MLLICLETKAGGQEIVSSFCSIFVTVAKLACCVKRRCGQMCFKPDKKDNLSAL